MNERCVTIPANHYEELIAAKAEGDMVKAFILKLSRMYKGATREEIELIKAMFYKEVEE